MTARANGSTGTKDAWRSRLLAARRALGPDARSSRDAALVAGVVRLAREAGGPVCAYLPMGTEPGGAGLVEALVAAGAEVRLPVVAARPAGTGDRAGAAGTEKGAGAAGTEEGTRAAADGSRPGPRESGPAPARVAPWTRRPDPSDRPAAEAGDRPPVVRDAAGPLDWARYDGTLRDGPLGLREPAGPRLGAGAVAEAALVLVPALAVDRTGIRLGRGGGFYDRTLPLATGRTVALLGEGELVDDLLPAEPHDRPVDAALLPAGLVTFGKTR